MGIDESKEKFDELIVEWSDNLHEIETEQDVRLQIIDRVLTEVLGWTHNEIKTEKHTDSGYVDYLIHSNGRNRLVLEAKRTSKLLIDTINPSVRHYKVSGSALNSAADGLKQAKKYCFVNGTGFAVLSTGIEWIAFLAVRTDGKPPKEGKAIVFPNFKSIQDKFATFYDLLSKDSVMKDLYKLVIHQAEGLSVQDIVELTTIADPSNIRLLPKAKISSDLEQILKEFFSSMSGDSDPEMLSNCFVQSKESREADANLEKITNNLLRKIEIVKFGKESELQRHIKKAVETQRGDFVLVIGNKGAGKSTYIDRFFRFVLDKNIRDRCLVLTIDLRDSTGDTSAIADWLTDKLKKEIELSLFKDNTPSYDELQGVYFQEYERWRKGEFKHLYDRDKTDFKIKFGEYIFKITEESPHDYVVKLLKNAVTSRRLMPCLVFDNADHYPQIFQDMVFQYSQSIFREVISFVILPITDRTLWQLSKSGPFQSYESTSFYLPIPSTKDVLSKRLEFVKHKIDEEKVAKSDYFLSKGIHLSISDINAFAASIEEIFINTDFIGRIIAWLANHDIRRSLRITQSVITSPRISIDDLVKAYLSGTSLSISEWDIMRALITGDYTYFKQDQSDFILNMFSIKPDVVTSPLIKLSIITLLHNQELTSTNQDLHYLTIEKILNYLEPIGYSRSACQNYLGDLLRYRLIEPYDPTDDTIYEDQRVRVTSSGKIHYEMAVGNETYVTQMALTTGIRDNLLVTKKRELFSGTRDSGKLSRGDWVKLVNDFIDYILVEDDRFITLPDLDIYKIQLRLRADLKKNWIK